MNQSLQTSSHLRAYKSSIEYFQDRLVVLDLIIEGAIHRMSHGHSKEAEQPTLLKGMYVSDAEAYQLLLQNEEFVQLNEEQQHLVTQIEQLLIQRLQITVPLLPLQQLQQRYQLDELDFRLLTVALAPQLHRKYIRLFGYLQDDLTCQYVTLDLLLRLCARNPMERVEIYRRMMDHKQGIAALFTSFTSSTYVAKEVSYLAEPLALKPRIVHFLLDMPWQYEGALAGARSEVPSLHTESLIIHQKLQQQLASYIEARGDQAFITVLIGASGAGKSLHSKLIASHLQKNLFIVDAANIVTARDQLNDVVGQYVQEAKLLNAILVIEHGELLQPNSQSTAQSLLTMQLQHCLVKHRQLVILHSTCELPFHVLPDSTTISVRIPLPTLAEAAKLWQHYSEPYYKLTEQLGLQLASKFQFTAGQIAASMMQSQELFQWQLALPGNQQPTVNEYPMFIHRAAYGMIHHGLQEKAVKMTSHWTWDDLVLPADTVSLLRQASQRLLHRHTVMEQWGFERILPYGRGISMLFTGPPGTGKTMSALVMAKAMGTELYRVDLTRVVSKYIGETEKNLAEIFDRAALSGAILFFDEADSLFGKRSEVKDSHDKYANMETSYLLQKMEEYEGLTILATNFSQNLDDAFMRRIHYIIKFPFPDAEQREQLWRSVLPANMPTEELDFPFLAKTFELSGGPIKNIVLTAAYMAAEQGSHVTMKHMVEAAIQEYKKTGKLLMRERLGQYSHYWKG